MTKVIVLKVVFIEYLFMRKPKKDFRVLSNKFCIDCGQPLKQNLIDKNPNALRCWVCDELFHSNPNRNMFSFKEKQRKLRVKFSN